MTDLYDKIATGYAAYRQADVRIARQIAAGIGLWSQGACLLNVGAGAGSYEPDSIPVVAVEASARMICQRRDTDNAVQARAEALPFADSAFDTVMAILTIHHWRNLAAGLAECARVASRRVVLLTWDPGAQGFWLTRDYFPDLLDYDRRIFPSLEELRARLGDVSTERVTIPADCTDGFLGAYWRRPEKYLDAAVRGSISSFSRISRVEARIERLRDDIASGFWMERNGNLLQSEQLDIGYRLVLANVS